MLDVSQLSPKTNYLLGLSGGRDSVCLLHLLLENGYRNLHLVHLDHQLRGQASTDDAHFVEKLAQEKQLPLTLERVSLTDQAQATRLSIETAARQARHQLFAATAQKTGYHQVLLAHHADDQAETCLFNLLRGSSGLKGMATQHQLTESSLPLTLVRPLLQTRRATIDAYLTEHCIPFREDKSNQSLDYTRNRIRQQALPLLEEILQRDIVPALLRAELATRAQERVLGQILDTLQLRDPQNRLFLPKLRELTPELQQACLKQYLTELKVPQLSHDLILRAQALISPEGPPAINLPGGSFLRRRQGRIFIPED